MYDHVSSPCKPISTHTLIKTSRDATGLGFIADGTKLSGMGNGISGNVSHEARHYAGVPFFFFVPMTARLFLASREPPVTRPRGSRAPAHRSAPDLRGSDVTLLIPAKTLVRRVL